MIVEWDLVKMKKWHQKTLKSLYCLNIKINNHISVFQHLTPGNEHRVAYEILEKINRKFNLFNKSIKMDIESFNHTKYSNIDNMYDTVFSGDGIVDVILNVKRM